MLLQYTKNHTLLFTVWPLVDRKPLFQSRYNFTAKQNETVTCFRYLLLPESILAAHSG